MGNKSYNVSQTDAFGCFQIMKSNRVTEREDRSARGWKGIGSLVTEESREMMEAANRNMFEDVTGM